MHDASYAPLTKSDVYAIKALAEGKAEPAQQIDALNWIISTLCETYDLEYRPLGKPDGMAIAMAMALIDGKRSVGLQLRRIIAQSMKVLVPEDQPATKPTGDLHG
jgi:hypothetical protein